MANTVIQLKYSTANSTPTSLNVGEPAYSFASGKLFIGNSTNAVLTIGGKYYTDLIDAATDANTASAIVKRDASGNFSATTISAALNGNASTATKWQTARNLGVSGDATGIVSVDGTANANIPLVLGSTGVAATTYGGTTSVPVFTVDAKGRLTYAANVTISTSMTFAGDTGSDTIAGGDTVTMVGGSGISTVVTAANNSVIFDVDNTVVRTTGGTISGDLSVTGNLVILGDTITQNVGTILSEDSMIKLAANNIADVVDIGFYGEYYSAGAKFTGLVRDASDSGKYKLFTGVTSDPTTNVVSLAAANRATLDANFTGGNVSSLFSAIAVADGGTGATSFTAGGILVGNGTSAVSILANTGTAATYGNSSHHPVITTDAYGRVASVTNTAVAIDASAVTSGTLAIARGGTNNTSYTSGPIIFFDGSKFASLANTGTAGTYANSTHIPVITTDAYGRVSAVTNTAISGLDTSVLSTGTLGVARGGTGAASFTVKGVIVSDSSSTTGALSALTSSTEGHLLTINSSGTPSFQHLSGGTF